MTFQAICFDLDGTLLNTIDDLADCMNEALGQLGLPPLSVEQCKLFVGDGLRVYAERAMGPASQDEELLGRCIALTRDQYTRRWADKTRPYEGVAELLDELTARGLKMTVLSNKPDTFTKLIVEKLLPRWRFDLVWGESPQRIKKPDPTSARQMAADLGLAPADFLYLGDTNTDMQTAVAAGMFPVGALWGFRSAQELTDNGAKVLIERPMDVLALLEGKKA